MAAVAGNVKVGNRKNLLTFLQELDYRMAINLERRAYAILNSVFVVPGAVGAWRRKAVLKVGGFSDATLTEDAELGLRLKKAGFAVTYEPQAVGFTEAPVTLPALIRQRFRWTFGMLQTLWFHKDMNFKPKYGYLGMLVLPYTVFIQLPSMFLAPIVELLAIPLALFVSVKLVLFSLLALLFGRFLLFAFASKLAGEDLSLSVLVIPYRFFYQFLWYFVLDAAILVAIRGSFVSWNKLPHFGTATSNESSKLWPLLFPKILNWRND